jgi:O-antigen ligase
VNIGLRAACSGLAAAGLLAALVVTGRELHLVALAAALVAIATQPRWDVRRDLPAVLVVIAWLSSRYFAPAPANALPMLTCVLVVCGAARLPPAIARALFAGCLTVAVLVLALVTAFELAKVGELRSEGYPGLEGWGGFPEIGLLGVMALPVAISLAIGAGPRDARAGAAIAALTIGAAVVLSGSRAAWGAAGIGTMLVLVGRRRGRWTAAAAAAVGVALAAIVVAMLWIRPQATSGAVGLDIASSSRLNAWGEAVRLWRERPLIGWGPATYHEVYASHHAWPVDSPLPADAQFHAHSAYLHLAVETGVLGLATALWFAAAVLAGIGSRAAPHGTMVAAARLGLVCGLIAVAVRFLVDYFDPGGPGLRVLLWLAIVAGLRLALESPRGETAA